MLTQERLKDLLHYNPDNGHFTWIKTTSPRVKVGAVADIAISHGYKYIGIDKQKYRVHRLAWLYMCGKFPEYYVDHIDGNPLNNALSNLREATHKQNLFNSKKPIHNTSGYKGVHFHKGTNKWRAVAYVDNYPQHIGLFKTAEKASEAYQSWCVKNRGAFARLGV